MQGPQLPISEELHAMKYRSEGETFRDAMSRIAGTLKDSDEHFEAFRNILLDMRFLPGGRVQAAVGAPKQVTAYNCFVSKTIPDSMGGIMEAATQAAQTMRMGGGIGYDFSTLRPRGDNIATLGSPSSGPLSFMNIFDTVCHTISSAGHRRGAQLATLRVDHPDIELFIKAKHNEDKLRTLNLSIGITDEFMQAVKTRCEFALKFDGKTVRWVDAYYLWQQIMRSTWDWAEPGVLFLDTINRENNLWYCENITTTNPCGEQPLPPYGACLLGSLNLTKYIINPAPDVYDFNWKLLVSDIPHIISAMDRVIDNTIYPLPEQEEEAKSKRRMGIGITGLGNVLSVLKIRYGSEEARNWVDSLLRILKNSAYAASVELAKTRGPFPMFDPLMYTQGAYIKRLPASTRADIAEYGIRNSHLISIAPTGTISLTADNISSGLEPAFSKGYTRTFQTYEGERMEQVEDYAWKQWKANGVYADDCSVSDHLGMLVTAQQHVDSAVSKTCNVGPDVTFDAFKAIYMAAWEGGAKGCTTFRSSGKRQGVLVKQEDGTNDAVCSIEDNSCKTCE